ncbi:MAG TPA: ParB N-terminal domain-containing protein [Spirochaetota bacterium]|nr:ParB N-terminal domain-containing protein [Spirochaetota bacterium]HOL56440.1 ParB N-terminal domain-containing protein [Spirochaetota bacterium]HPP04456.1 ParB N-terminal domain-containing protein [Spirochaetota bacterium]
MKIRIDEIKIPKKRFRKEIGEISVLMKSMSKYGLLQPIIIDKSYNLIAGYRRYIAAKKLGWQIIDATIVDIKDKLSRVEIEIDENTVRKDFTFEEINEAIDRRDKLTKPSIFKMIINFFKKLFRL